jgi:uncharacterized protein (TIGR00290 family)
MLTTVEADGGRVAMHGTSRSLLEAQADALGFDLRHVALPEACGNDDYERLLASGLAEFSKDGIDTVACGDLFLEDIRSWREQSFGRLGWRPVFPIWRTPTREMAYRLAEPPWEIIVTGVDTAVLDERFLGERYDAAFLDALPDTVDPCGENGEFHTFVCNGPGFERRLAVTPGKRLLAHERYLSLQLDPA